MLSDADDRERSILGAIGYAPNSVYLHRDIRLDRLAAADRQSALFGVNRVALYSFNEADHGERDGSSLRQYAQACPAERGIVAPNPEALAGAFPERAAAAK